MLDAQIKASLSIASFAAGSAMMGVVMARLRYRAATALSALACTGAALGAVLLANASTTRLPRPPSPDDIAAGIVRIGHAYDAWRGRDTPQDQGSGDGTSAIQDAGPPAGALGVSAMHEIDPEAADAADERNQRTGRAFRGRNPTGKENETSE